MGKRGPAKGAPKTPGSGRKAGSLNKRTLEAREWAEINGYPPTMGLEYFARVLKSAMTPAVAPNEKDPAEQFYQGKLVVSAGEAGSDVIENWGRATADMAQKAAAEFTQYMYGKRSAIRVDFKKPHDMTDDELNAAIRLAMGGDSK